MKIFSIILWLGYSFSVLQAQDSLTMKYQYTFEVERRTGYPIIPLQKYAQVFPTKNGLKEKADTTTPYLLQLHTTWRAKRNEVLNHQDFHFLNISDKTIADSVLFKSTQQETFRDREWRKSRIMIDRMHAGNTGGRVSREYFANPPKIPTPYENCQDEDDFKYTIPTLHEIDWLILPQNTSQDTVLQRRLFFTDSTLITIHNQQWRLLDVSYCVGHHFPDTVNNTTLKWTYQTVPLPPPPKAKKEKYKIKTISAKKKKSIKIGRMCYIFSDFQQLFDRDEYLIKCTIKYRQQTYYKNVFLGKNSQLVFNGILLQVLDTQSDKFIIKYTRSKPDN